MSNTFDILSASQLAERCVPYKAGRSQCFKTLFHRRGTRFPIRYVGTRGAPSSGRFDMTTARPCESLNDCRRRANIAGAGILSAAAHAPRLEAMLAVI